MKRKRWITWVVVIAVLLFAAHDLLSNFAMAREYYGTHPHVLWITFGVAALIGMAALMYRDKVERKTNILHAFIGTSILALGISLFTMECIRTTWQCRDLIFRTTPKNRFLVIAFPFLPAGAAVALWWEAWNLKKKHRTSGLRLS